MVFAVTKCTEELYKKIVELKCNLCNYITEDYIKRWNPTYFAISTDSGQPIIQTVNFYGSCAKELNNKEFINYYFELQLEIRSLFSFANHKVGAIERLTEEIKKM